MASGKNICKITLFTKNVIYKCVFQGIFPLAGYKTGGSVVGDLATYVHPDNINRSLGFPHALVCVRM
jgi:hypothetical protein